MASIALLLCVRSHLRGSKASCQNYNKITAGETCYIFLRLFSRSSITTLWCILRVPPFHLLCLYRLDSSCTLLVPVADFEGGGTVH